MLLKAEQKPLLEVKDKARIEGYVVYLPSERWYARFLKKDYGHCILLVRKEDFWVVVDPSLSMMEVSILPVGYPIRQLFGGKFQRFTLWRDTKQVRIKTVIAPFTCVELIKSILALGKFSIITPYQLKTYLEQKHGFTIQQA